MKEGSQALQNGLASHIEINSQDLPLSCPMPRMTLWNMHPKVYLSLPDKGEVSCPYCGTKYVLVTE